MRLFLFLSALLAGLAGIVPGVRAATPVEAGLSLGASASSAIVGAVTPAAHRHLIPATPGAWTDNAGIMPSRAMSAALDPVGRDAHARRLGRRRE